MHASRFVLRARAESPCGLFHPDAFAALRRYIESNPSLAPTPLLKSKALGKSLGIKSLWLKDETERYALPAFKALGARFAVSALLERGALRAGDTLVCASEGNHGRAVARAARDFGLGCRVYVGARVAESRAEAIRLEGAQVIRVDGSYDDAVRRSAADAREQGWQIISDTGWPGYEEIPRLIMLGYTRLMDEAAAEWKSKPPSLVLVQGGVGGLAAAVASWYAAHPELPRPRLVCVEPLRAACLLESAAAGAPMPVAGPMDTIMGGLRCGEVSSAAWPAVLEGYDAFVAIDDAWSRRAMLRLARATEDHRPLACGPSGAAGVAALMAIVEDPALGSLREALDLRPKTRAMAIVTEGVTEPELYEEVVGGGAGARRR